jgi:hypothetical protein
MSVAWSMAMRWVVILSIAASMGCAHAPPPALRVDPVPIALPKWCAEGDGARSTVCIEAALGLGIRGPIVSVPGS